MGASLTVTYPKQQLEDSIRLIMPVYYTEAAPTPYEIDLALHSFNHIRDDTSTRYFEMKADPKFLYDSCLEWFYHSFYERLFDVQPQTRVLFSKIGTSQGHGLAMLINVSLRQLKKPDEFRESMKDLAKQHFERNVKAVEYGMFGDILFWALHHVLPPDVFNIETERAWIKIFSAMLTQIVPAALRYERSHSFSSKRSEALMRCNPMDPKDSSTSVIFVRERDKRDAVDDGGDHDTDDDSNGGNNGRAHFDCKDEGEHNDTNKKNGR